MRNFKLLYTLAILLITTSTIGQTTYYIGVNGNDKTGKGTYDEPFKTVKKVNTLLESGDFVYFKAGIYKNASYDKKELFSKESTVAINKVKGEKGKYITFSPAPGEKVKLKGNGRQILQIRDSKYVIVKNFEIEGDVDSIDL